MSVTYSESLEWYYKRYKSSFKQQLYYVLFGLLGISLLACIFYGLGLESIHVLSRVNFFLHSILFLITIMLFSVLIDYMVKDETLRKYTIMNTETNLEELTMAMDTYEYKNKYKWNILVTIAYITFFIGGVESLIYISKMFQEATHLSNMTQNLTGISLFFLIFIPSLLMNKTSNNEVEGFRKFCKVTGGISFAFILLSIFDWMAAGQL